MPAATPSGPASPSSPSSTTRSTGQSDHAPGTLLLRQQGPCDHGLVEGCGWGGTQLAQPGDDVLLPGSRGTGGIQRRAVRVGGDPVQAGPARQQVLGGAALAG